MYCSFDALLQVLVDARLYPLAVVRDVCSELLVKTGGRW